MESGIFQGRSGEADASADAMRFLYQNSYNNQKGVYLAIDRAWFESIDPL